MVHPAVSWLQEALRERKRGQAAMIDVEWTPHDHPSKAQQQKPKESWDVVVRDWHGGEFCRRAFVTRSEADEALTALRKQLAACNGNVLGMLEKWAGHSVQVPLWWGDNRR